jgi:hypothetical protein
MSPHTEFKDYKYFDSMEYELCDVDDDVDDFVDDNDDGEDNDGNN